VTDRPPFRSHPQKAIIDVMRTSATYGTLSNDIVRAVRREHARGVALLWLRILTGPFALATPGPLLSALSCCCDGGVPSIGTDCWMVDSAAAWNGRLWQVHKCSYVHALHAFGFMPAPCRRRSNVCWFDELVATVAMGIPVVTLSYYSANHSDGTHFRVAVGYDSASDSITLLDPWDRENTGGCAGGGAQPVGGGCGGKQPRVVTYSRSDWCELWSYAEINGNLTALPYFAAVHVPWSVDVTYEETNQDELAVMAVVSYVLPPAFQSAFALPTATNVTAAISLPPTLSLAPGSAPLVVSLPALVPGAQAAATWACVATGAAPTAAATEISVRAGARVCVWGGGALQYVPHQSSSVAGPVQVVAQGAISSSVPPTFWGPPVGWWPGYSYTDLIGGSGSSNY
jgi:hypothetical protein